MNRDASTALKERINIATKVCTQHREVARRTENLKASLAHGHRSSMVAGIANNDTRTERYIVCTVRPLLTTGMNRVPASALHRIERMTRGPKC